MIAVVLAAFTIFFRQPLQEGWRTVYPGLGQQLTCIASILFSSLIVWVWAVVGSARSDGAFQMGVAWWLAMAFGLGAMAVGVQMWLTVRQNVSWRGDKLTIGRDRMARALQEVDKVDPVSWGRVRLRFKDGFVLSIDLSNNGADALLQRVYRIKGMEDFLDPPEH